VSMTEDEYAYDEYMTQLYEEHKKEAIEEFTYECLQSYYINNKLMAQPAFLALSEARSLIESNKSAALIFAAIAMEVGLKATLLKPIVYGLVHTESAAALITDLTISRTGMDRYRKLLFQVLKEHGGIDLSNFKRTDSNKTLWEEINKVRENRNIIMHRAGKAEVEDADLALAVASEILESIFPAIIAKMGLHLHDGYRICNNLKCQYKSTPLESVLNSIYRDREGPHSSPLPHHAAYGSVLRDSADARQKSNPGERKAE